MKTFHTGLLLLFLLSLQWPGLPYAIHQSQYKIVHKSQQKTNHQALNGSRDQTVHKSQQRTKHQALHGSLHQALHQMFRWDRSVSQPDAEKPLEPNIDSRSQNRDIPYEQFEFTERHMGTLFRVVIYADNSSKERAMAAADSAFRKAAYLNSIFSDYDPQSELSRLSANAGSGKKTVVSDPLFRILQMANSLSVQTDGAFDVTAGPYTLAWREVIRGLRTNIPDPDELQAMAESVGYQHMELDSASRSVLLRRPGMRLDLGGIAKGYAADRMMNVLRSFDFQSVLIDAGGDMVAGDPPPGRNGWRISIPIYKSEDQWEPFIVEISNRALTSSGNLYQFFEQDGIRYSHIVNPKTGKGVTGNMVATVTGPSGTWVDAWATALHALGLDGLHLIEKTDGYDAIIQFRDEQNNEKVTMTPFFREVFDYFLFEE